MNKAGLVAVTPTALLLAGLLILLVYHQTTDYFRKREIAHVIGMLPGDDEAVVLAGETRLLRRDFRMAALHSMGSYDALPDVIVEMVDRGRVQELASRLGIAATDVDVEMSIRERPRVVQGFNSIGVLRQSYSATRGYAEGIPERHPRGNTT